MPRHRVSPRRPTLYRSRDRVLAGVCGGIAEHFDFAPWAVRLVFLGLLFTIAPWIFLVYLALALLLRVAPEERFRTYEDEEFHNVFETSRHEALRKVKHVYDSLEERLRRMETLVTSRKFEWEDEFRKKP